MNVDNITTETLESHVAYLKPVDTSYSVLPTV